jgi:hypothetical protein
MRCLLYDFGADVNVTDNDSDTALMVAARETDAKICKLLVKAGADINFANYCGNTALIIAAHCKNAVLTKWLVKAGANPQAKNGSYHTAGDISRVVGASPEQTAYLEAKAHCAQPGCSGAGTKKCQGCMQGRYCGPACHVAHWPAHKAECRRLGAALKSAQEEGGE